MATLMARRPGASDDPRRLRDLLDRARSLAIDHRVPSVIVGLAAEEGDLVFPELVDFVQSALRIEDAVFRMTRERAVLVLSDTTQKRAEGIVQRLLADFHSEFPTTDEREVSVGYFTVPPGSDEVSVRQVLPAVFAAETDEATA